MVLGFKMDQIEIKNGLIVDGIGGTASVWLGCKMWLESPDCCIGLKANGSHVGGIGFELELLKCSGSISPLSDEEGVGVAWMSTGLGSLQASDNNIPNIAIINAMLRHI